MRASALAAALVIGVFTGGCPDDPAPPDPGDNGIDAATDLSADQGGDSATSDGATDAGPDTTAETIGDTGSDGADGADGSDGAGGDITGDADAAPEVFTCTSSLECEDKLGPQPDCKRAQCQADMTCAVMDRPDLTPCEDGDACTTGDKCASGQCVGGFDQCQCTNDSDCDHLDDGNKCNGVWTCQTDSCAFDAASVVDCGSGDACTDSDCDVLTGACQANSKPDGTACDDASVCTTLDLCQSGSCVGTTPLDCGQPAQCQEAVCDAVGGCSFANLDTGACDDGDACTANDACSAGVCGGEAITCTPSGPCLAASCDTQSGCSEAPIGDGLGCDDDDPCTDADTCQAGACIGTQTCSCSVEADCPDVPTNLCLDYACDGGGFCAPKPPITCAQNPNPCVVSECLPATGQCGLVELSNGALCDSGACFVGGKCIDATCQASPLPCDDGNLCTIDSCDDTLGCQSVADDGGACEDGDLCTLGDTCDDAGACTAGPPNPCDDGDECTADTCVPGVGCKNDEGADCDDGDVCTTDICVPGVGCQNNAKICFGNIETCLIPTCLQTTGECGLGPAPNGFACDDEDACTEGEDCSGGDCIGTAVDCDDADACTADSCDSAAGCQNVPIPNCP